MPANRSTRQRKLPGPILKGEGKNEHESSYSPIFEIDCAGRQVTVSEGHHWPRPTGHGLVDEGGDFYSSKSYVSAVPPSYVQLRADWVAAGQVLGYNGHLLGLNSAALLPDPSGMVNRAVPSFPPTFELTNSEMDQNGTTAIARCKPGEPVADISTALGELMKDGLPTIPNILSFASRSPVGKTAGEYLNYQFGIRPLVKDVQKFVSGVTRADEVLRQLERDSGRVVRRRYSFPLDSTFETTQYDPVSGPFGFQAVNQFVRNKYGIPPSAPSYRERSISRKIWFSGAFTYFLPDDWYSSQGIKAFGDRVNAVLGTDLTAEMLWNLAPWSWALDWFSSTGDVISNLQSFQAEGLVMHYGYLMANTIVTDTYGYGPLPDFPGRPVISTFQLVTETKQRRKANPFGFGVDWNDLNPFQLSIAAALGLSRSR